jgi:uncharacterized protein YoxC
MSIEWFRDLVVCISGLVLAGVLIFVAIIAYSVYRRVKYILDSMKATSLAVQDMISYARDEVARPLAQVAVLVKNIRQGIDSISALVKRK